MPPIINGVYCSMLSENNYSAMLLQVITPASLWTRETFSLKSLLQTTPRQGWIKLRILFMYGSTCLHAGRGCSGYPGYNIQWILWTAIWVSYLRPDFDNDCNSWYHQKVLLLPHAFCRVECVVVEGPDGSLVTYPVSHYLCYVPEAIFLHSVLLCLQVYMSAVQYYTHVCHFIMP